MSTLTILRTLPLTNGWQGQGFGGALAYPSQVLTIPWSSQHPIRTICGNPSWCTPGSEHAVARSAIIIIGPAGWKRQTARRPPASISPRCAYPSCGVGGGSMKRPGSATERWVRQRPAVPERSDGCDLCRVRKGILRPCALLSVAENVGRLSPFRPPAPIRTRMEHRDVLIKRVRRRQHSSCDQCRKAKRACDAAFKGEHAPLHDTSASTSTVRHPLYPGKTRVPAAKCSNCLKAGRNCTFEWLECALPKVSKGFKRKPQPRHDLTPSRERSGSKSSHNSTYASIFESDPDVFSDLGIQNLDFDHIDDVELFGDWVLKDSSFDPGVSAAQLHGLTGSDGTDNQTPAWEPFLRSNINPASLLHARSWTEDNTVLQSIEEVHDQELTITQGQQSQHEEQEPYPPGSCIAPSECSSAPIFTDDEFSSSLFSTNTLSSGTNRWLLAQNWLRVYHDSLENALSCWLTERNCPYTLTRTGGNGLSSAWGPQWSNRIYKRVCSLDNFVNEMPGRCISRTENSMAGKALNAAVMAFGVQWAQAGNRGNLRDRVSSFISPSSVHEEMNLPAADEFGRSVQEALWNQARQALQEAAGIQSYRVAFANIIFSLTQRPLDPQDWAQSTSWKPRGGDWGNAGSFQSGLTVPPNCGRSGPRQLGLDARWEALQEIINADGPPVFLEAASRQLISSRWKWEQYSRQQAMGSSRSSYDFQRANRWPSTATVTPSREHRETFQLLSWLAIMFDTLSSAILRRPPVVADEDTSIDSSDPWETVPESPVDVSEDGFPASSLKDIDLDGWEPGSLPPKPPKQRHSSDIWDSFFLENEDLERRNQNQRSFSLEAAAAILCDAAPVKVLLFRKVGHIQRLMSRRARSDALEQALDKAVKVYTFWNRSYGKFIAQCVSKHHELPARIQSWYLVLAGHWHLGAILLADVVEELDEAGLSQPAQRNMRRMCNFSDDMRRKNATAISELCRCSLHGHSLSFPTASEFTYPVNQVALLSEPWTLVLIQSFSRAGYVFVSQLNAPPRRMNAGWSTVEDERNLARRRCEYCIEGLLNLANKSDMAFLAGRFLRDCLRDLDSF